MRRAMVTFPYTFTSVAPVNFAFRPATPKTKKTSKPPIEFEFVEDKLIVGADMYDKTQRNLRNVQHLPELQNGSVPLRRSG